MPPELIQTLESLDDPGLASRRLRRLMKLVSSLEPGDVYMNVVTEQEAFYLRIDVQLMLTSDGDCESWLADEEEPA